MTYQCDINIMTAIDWQRGNAESLNKLLSLKQAWYKKNHCDFWNDWVVDVFDLRTANEFGISVWSLLLDVPLFDSSQESRVGYPAIYFGNTRKNFGRGNFGVNASEIAGLTVDQKRVMLQLKAIIINTRSSAYEINKKLYYTFGEQAIYAIDNLDMTYTYVINDETILSCLTTIQSYDLLPRPCGVEVII